jgi:hypothetical protein
MKQLVITFLFSIASALYAQIETIDIQWDENHGLPSFPHALYEDGENTLPYFTGKFTWDRPGMLPVVHLVVRGTEPVEAGLPEQVPTDHVKEAPLLEYALVREAKKPFVTIRVLPFLRNASGSLERVTSFEVHIEQEKTLAALKSAMAGEWAASSVLSSGSWFMVSVEKSGIHKLTYEQLKEIGLQDPASVRIYGTGARQLPENFSQGYTDDLQPVPVCLHKGGDGLFGPGDYLLFYAQGPVSWQYLADEEMFVHRLHDYTLKGYYFLTGDHGAPVTPEAQPLSTETPTHTVTDYDYRAYFEEETYNLINSGREWYGDNFNVNLEENYPFALPERESGEEVRIRVTAAARSNEVSSFIVKANGNTLGNIELGATDLSTHTAIYADEQTGIFTFIPGQDNLTVTLAYDHPNTNSEGWLNAITINGRSRLGMYGDELPFRDSRSAGTGNVGAFRVENCNTGTLIWEISDPFMPRDVAYTLAGSTAMFTLETGEIREFVAFNTGGAFPSPAYGDGEGGAVNNQNLHGLGQPDMVIITPEEFLDAAEDLAALREAADELEVEVVTQQQVFNEFSSGAPDAAAIRNFMKMFYDRAGSPEEMCRYLLLFGDGSYDNRSHTDNNPNLVLTYQSDNSLSPTRSYVSDDFFGLLDTDESMYDGLLDIGIGRLPASTPEEARILVDKIISYSEPVSQGNWRNQLCFIGDDEDSNIHMRQADELASYVTDRYPAYNINKIYLDAYQQVKLANGFRYPEVTRAINDQVSRGALIVNYTGHGGPNGLAHEQVLSMTHIKGWTNRNMLPLFMTATCEFSRYDEYDHGEDQEIPSAGEEVLLNPEGGGIALFSTTRLVYSGPNQILNEKFYEVVFEKDGNGQYYRLGDIIAYSKNNAGAGINKRNFTLLGDPSLKLAYPVHRVVTDSINGTDIRLLSDTLSAFEWVTVSGHMETREGSVMDDFHGTVYPIVFDKERYVETLSNDNDPVWGFESRNSILYSGKADVSGGRFSFGFFVPKDINYAIGPGKISYYSNNAVVDAQGYTEQFFVGGIGQENTSDDRPPEITLYMNDTFFVSGGITDPDPVLLAQVSDNYGINTTGNGIGHDATATMDGDRINAIILNDYYQANVNSYNSGTIRYPYSGLGEGRHELTVKIWDIHNNSAESALEFVVMDSEEMLLEQLYNYPNPFIDQTWFNIEHNRPDSELRLVLTIYNLSGEIVRIFDTRFFSPGYRLEPVRWDGTSEGGARLGGGIYLYRATLSTTNGEVASGTGKLVIAR